MIATELHYVQNVPNWDRFTIVGTNQEIFKDYLRLTMVRSILHFDRVTLYQDSILRNLNQNKFVLFLCSRALSMN